MKEGLSIKRSRADSRPSIGFARRRRFDGDDQPSLSAFSTVLAHRVRSLLTGIEGFTDLLLQSMDAPEQREIAFRILESSTRIEGILFDLQHFNDPLEARFHRIPAVAIANDVLTALADSELDRLRPDIRVDSSVHLRADESLIRQAVLAMLKNAFEAADIDSPVDFIIDTGTTAGFVTFSIGNSSSIDDPIVRRRMFEPFFTTKANNLGLGLTLAKRIASIHDGQLSYTKRDSDGGSEFSLSLPIFE